MAGMMFRNVSMIAMAAVTASPVWAQSAPEEATPKDATATAEEIVVTGISQAPTDMLTRAPATLIETSNSISLVPRELIEARSATNLLDILKGVAGVSRSISGSRSANNRLVIRGFDSTSAIASPMVRENNLPGGVNYPADPAIYERVEVIKGPAAIQGGAAVPGGYVNNVLKSPFEDERLRFGVSGDTFGKARANVDYNTPLDENGDVLARIVVAGAIGDEAVRGENERHISITPSLLITPGPDTRIKMSLNVHHGRGDPFAGLPVLPTGGEPDVPLDFNFDTDGERSKIDYFGADIEITHDFLDSLRLTARGGYRDSVNDNIFIYGYSLAPNGDATIYANRLRRDDRAFVGDVFLTKSFGSGETKSTLTAGVELLRSKNFAKSGYSYVGTDNIFNPANRFTLPAGFDFGDTLDADNNVRLKQTGVYAQVILRPTAALTFMAGGRVDFVDIEGTERAIGVNTDVNEEKFTGRLGASYSVADGFNLYASYAESYTPLVHIINSALESLPSETADQIEGGFKAELFSRKLLLTGAVFEITRSNVPVPDPASRRFSLSVGEQRHRGIELEAIGEPLPGLTISAAYSYLDTEVTKSTTAGVIVGTRTRYAPKHQFSLFADYTIGEGPLEGLGIGGSVFYRSRIFANPNNSIPFSGYVEFDGFLSYEVNERITLRLAVKNVTNERFIASPGTSYLNKFGAPRHALLSAFVSF